MAIRPSPECLKMVLLPWATRAIGTIWTIRTIWIIRTIRTIWPIRSVAQRDATTAEIAVAVYGFNIDGQITDARTDSRAIARAQAAACPKH